MNKNILKSFCVSSKNRFPVDSFFRRHAFQAGVGFFSSDSRRTTRCHVLIHLPLINFFRASICLEIFILTLVRAQMQMQTHDVRPTMQARSLHTGSRAHTHSHENKAHTPYESEARRHIYTNPEPVFPACVGNDCQQAGLSHKPCSHESGADNQIETFSMWACMFVCFYSKRRSRRWFFSCLLCAIKGENHLS